MENIEEVFMENGYPKAEVQRAMKERDERTRNNDDNDEEKIRGIVSVPNIPKITRVYSRIAKYNFQTTSQAN